MATVVPNQVDFDARDDVAKSRMNICCARNPILNSLITPGYENQLEISVVEYSGFNIEGCGFVRGKADVVPFRIVAIVTGIRKVHLELKMPRIHGVGAVGFIRAVGAERTQILSRRGVEKIITRFIGQWRLGIFGDSGVGGEGG